MEALGASYYNPDIAARAIRAGNPSMPQRQANGLAWNEGRRLLERAIAGHLDFAFETTLGAATIPRLLSQAADQGAEVWVWYAGLDSVQRHLARVRARVVAGGHDIPEADIRRRWENSRLNLVALMPKLGRLYVYDNSLEADPRRGKAPQPRLLLEMQGRRIARPGDLSATPDWAKPIVARALQLAKG
jgi:predicted ABC-type ATPase